MVGKSEIEDQADPPIDFLFRANKPYVFFSWRISRRHCIRLVVIFWCIYDILVYI